MGAGIATPCKEYTAGQSYNPGSDTGGGGGHGG